MPAILGNIIALLAVAGIVWLSVREIRKSHKGGGCGGCSGNCAGCGGSCSSCNGQCSQEQDAGLRKVSVK